MVLDKNKGIGQGVGMQNTYRFGYQGSKRPAITLTARNLRSAKTKLVSAIMEGNECSRKEAQALAAKAKLFT